MSVCRLQSSCTWSRAALATLVPPCKSRKRTFSVKCSSGTKSPGDHHAQLPTVPRAHVWAELLLPVRSAPSRVACVWQMEWPPISKRERENWFTVLVSTSAQWFLPSFCPCFHSSFPLSPGSGSWLLTRGSRQTNRECPEPQARFSVWVTERLPWALVCFTWTQSPRRFWHLQSKAVERMMWSALWPGPA